jgi:twitching motility protein PilT
MEATYTAKELLNLLILTLVKEGGSDIHLMIGMPPAVRIHGEIISITKLASVKSGETIDVLKEMINDDMFAKFKVKQQIDFSYTHMKEYRLRGHAFYEKSEVSLVLRLIPKVKNVFDLNLPPILQELSLSKQGFFLVTGPVGQGKSTTLASMVDYINRNEKKIITTIEDPIEYIHVSNKSYVTQREVGFDTGSFTEALSASLRQDCDVILIGEMRDSDAIKTAVTAAETGHLVISTLHTNSASQTIDRIIDSFPNEQQNQIRSQLAASLLGIFSQRLLSRIGGGLFPIYELMLTNTAVQNLIREKRTYEIDNIINTNSSEGMISFDKCLADAVLRGDIALDTAMKSAKDVKSFEQLI